MRTVASLPTAPPHVWNERDDSGDDQQDLDNHLSRWFGKPAN
ncbi:hypothetical protein [Embleya sp. NPDC005575]